jgi:Asp-tRNA(Asn)/Glu-tRNA(Gln) amidotransferase A subunit family amidase
MLHLTQTSRLTRYTIPASLLGLPALALPLGTAPCRSTGARLPTSLQLIGRPWQDATVLRVGAVLEAGLREAGFAAPLPALRMPNPLVKAVGKAKGGHE